MQSILVITTDDSLVDMLHTVADDLYAVLHITDPTQPRPSGSIGLILFDVSDDPHSAAEQIRAMQKPSYGVLVIADAAQADLLPEYVEAGARDYLIKPVSTNLLHLRVLGLTQTSGLIQNIHGLWFESKRWLPTIQGYAELLIKGKAGELNEKQQLFAEYIYKHAKNLTKLLELFQILTRVAEKRMQFDFQLTPIAGLLADWLDQTEKTYQHKQHTVVRTVACESQLVMADQKYLKQAVEVLLDNAFRYTPDEGKIEVIAHSDENLISVAITDNGIGISSDWQTYYIFEFWGQPDDRQAEQYRKNEYGGSLFFARYMIRKHGGDIWFESEVGKGTTFYFTLPIAAD